jgi:hypothetical protein
MFFCGVVDPLVLGAFEDCLRASVFLKNRHFAQSLSIFNSITPLGADFDMSRSAPGKPWIFYVFECGRDFLKNVSGVVYGI